MLAQDLCNILPGDEEILGFTARSGDLCPQFLGVMIEQRHWAVNKTALSPEPDRPLDLTESIDWQTGEIGFSQTLFSRTL